MHVLDASAIVHGWDNYPPNLFPGLWTWIEAELVGNALAVPKVALDEIGHVSPQCAQWLVEANAPVITMNNAIVGEALRIKACMGIVNDGYHPGGVDENDLLIIATASTRSATLVTNEAIQPSRPSHIPRYKIPAVCQTFPPPHSCIDFLSYIKRAGRAFS